MKLLIRFTLLTLSVLTLPACVTVSPDVGGEPKPEQAAQLNVQLGVRYMQQGRRDLAMEKLQKAIEQDSDLPDAHTAIALLYEQMGEVQLAKQHYHRALRIDSKNPVSQNNYGTFLCRQGEYRDSEDYFLAAARNPKYGTPEVAWTNAGICVARIPDHERAESYYRKALEINPRFQDALLQMAELSLEQKRYMQGRAFMQRFAEIGQMNPQALYTAVMIERGLGDERAAQRYLQTLWQDYPDSPEAGKLRGHRGQ